MSRKSRKNRNIKPTFFVFCEGETEVAYVNYLRSKYRLPIVIDAKRAGHDISSNYIKRYKQKAISHPKDRTYLIYDMDVIETWDKVKRIKGVSILGSNPCFELWFLLHFMNQKAFIECNSCVSKLSNYYKRYKKGHLEKGFIDKLESKISKAIERSKSLLFEDNPSTNINEFIEDLEAEKSKTG
jgi:hypothetical protein